MIEPIRFTRHIGADGGSKYLDLLVDTLTTRPFLGIFNVTKTQDQTTKFVNSVSFWSSGGHYSGKVHFVPADSQGNKLKYDHLKLDIATKENGLPEIYFALVERLGVIFNYHPDENLARPQQ